MKRVFGIYYDSSRLYSDSWAAPELKHVTDDLEQANAYVTFMNSKYDKYTLKKGYPFYVMELDVLRDDMLP